MEKSKLGIAKELLAAGIFIGALAGGYVFAGAMVLYVLLKEDDQWLKEMAVKALKHQTINVPIVDDLIKKYV